MLDLNDPRWDKLEGGYRVKYDPRKALAALLNGQVADAWSELWNELHHQGDVGLASYAAVPHLVKIGDPDLLDDWNLYALIATIEICRTRAEGNPRLPDQWKPGYEAAPQKIAVRAFDRLRTASEDSLLASLFAICAIGKHRPALASCALLSEEERVEMLDEAGWG